MHVIIFYQIVIFSRLINFYKFFNDMYFIHTILLLESNVESIKTEEWVQR